jgi:hypothetical protein
MGVQVPHVRAMVTLFTTLVPMERSTIRGENWLGISALTCEEMKKLAHR